MTGVIVKGVVESNTASFPEEIVSLGYITWIFTGILVFNLHFLLTKRRLDPKVEEIIRYIQQQEKLGLMSPIEASMMYKAINMRLLESISSNRPIENQFDDFVDS